MDGETEALPPDHLRCNRNDGRRWRCKNPSVFGKSHCATHLHRFSQNKTLKFQDNYPPTRMRLRVKPEPYDDTSPHPTRQVGTRERVRCGKNDGRSWRCKREVVAGENMSDIHLSKGKRSPKTKRSNVGEEGENGDSGGLRSEVVRCRRDSGNGWRCRKAAKDGFSRCEKHLSGNARVKGTENWQVKAKAKAKAKEEGLPDELRCTRNDGREWRCKRRVFEGQTLCEAHFKGIKLINVKPRGGKKAVKKKVVIKEEVESEKEEGDRNRVAKTVGIGRKEGEEEWRCKRTDGRGWRCKRRVSQGKTMCEIHYEQGRLRQKKITVPESMKLQRGEGGERIEKKLKRKRAMEILENNSDKGMKRMKADLIRVFLRREILELNKKKSECDSLGNSHLGEVTRDLPYGLMSIPQIPPSRILDNVGSLGIKVGVHSSSNSLVQRRFRSKNIEPLPVGPLKVVPFAGNVRKKCHRCQNRDESSLTKCLSCRKLFFCAKCIKERNAVSEEVQVKCEVCCGTCDCMACCSTQPNGVNTKEISRGTLKGSKFYQLQYLIKLLLPILEGINQEQSIEAEAEARFKGQDQSDVDIRQAEVGCSDQCCCNNCKSPILDFHRSCPNCSYNLCLSCCRAYTQGGPFRETESYCSQPCTVMKTHLPDLRIFSEKMLINNSAHSSDGADLAVTATLSDSISPLHISCPPMELGGCDSSLLDLRCIFPLNWTKELEIIGKEIVSRHALPQATDNSMHCSLCSGIAEAADKDKEIQEASRRINSHDNYVYCPCSSDDHYNVLTHFQKHWRLGHPVKVRNVLQCESALSLDPLSVFCRSLENNPNKCLRRKRGNEVTNCTDWYEVDIGTSESFAQSQGQVRTHRRHKTLRVKAMFSSTFSRRLFEDHLSDIIHALPLQEYTNPSSGVLNVGGKLLEDFPESKLGPHVCISFGSREVVARGELVTNLHYNSYDMVNILTHVDNASCSTEQLNKVLRLIRLNEKKNQNSQNLENGETIIDTEISNDIALRNGDVGATCCLTVTNNSPSVNLRDDKSPVKLQSSDTDSDASMVCSGTSDAPYKSADEMSHIERLESRWLSDERPFSAPCGAQWDVFRRQDVPKLVEYITRHVEELSFSCDILKDVVHLIFDGNFYLDSTHKMQLKEEFDIEPWTFNQCLGEAVFIPAGCPYQMRYAKSCVNIALGFISPENVSECIKLIKERHVLPNNHEAKEVKLEVEKMTICSIDEAIKEIYLLQREESSLFNKSLQKPIPNS